MIPALRSRVCLGHHDRGSLWSWGSGFELLLLTRGLSAQDNYTFAQPGIQKKVKALEELVSRIDGR